MAHKELHAGHSHDHTTTHDSHHGSHHETRHYSEVERLLYGLPKNTWNRCTDAFLDYRNCVKSKAERGFPIQFIFNLHWADRWACRDEDHSYKECEMQRMLDIYEQHKEEIAERRQ